MAAEPSEGRERPVWYTPRRAPVEAPPVANGDLFARDGFPGTWTVVSETDMGGDAGTAYHLRGSERGELWTSADQLTEAHGVRRLEAPIGMGWRPVGDAGMALLVSEGRPGVEAVGRAEDDGAWWAYPGDGSAAFAFGDAADLDAAKRAVHVALATRSVRPPAEAASVEAKACLCNHMNAYACAEAPRRGAPHDCACHRPAVAAPPLPCSDCGKPECFAGIRECEAAKSLGRALETGAVECSLCGDRHLEGCPECGLPVAGERLPDPASIALSPEAAEIDDAVMARDVARLGTLAERHLRERRKAESERDEARALALSDECMASIGRIAVALRLGPEARGLPATLAAAAEALEGRRPASSTLATVSTPAADLGDLLAGVVRLPLDQHTAARLYAEAIERVIEAAVRRATAGTVPRAAYEVSERQRIQATHAEERMAGELEAARRRVSALERAGGIASRGGAVGLDVDLVLSSARTLTAFLRERREQTDAIVMVLADQLAAAVDGEAGR